MYIITQLLQRHLIPMAYRNVSYGVTSCTEPSTQTALLTRHIQCHRHGREDLANAHPVIFAKRIGIGRRIAGIEAAHPLQIGAAVPERAQGVVIVRPILFF